MKTRWLSLALTGLLLAASSSQDASGQEGLRYNQVQQKHTHNSYQRREGVLDQVLYYSVRSLEIDIHINKPGEEPVDGDWYVWHTKGDVDTTTCKLFSECLEKIASVNQVIPEHEIVTIWVEFKDYAFDDSTHTPAKLNSLLEDAVGGADRILTPANLMKDCPSATNLQASVKAPCHWPTLAALKGRYVFVLLGEGENDYDFKTKFEKRRAFTQGNSGNFQNEPERIFFNVDSQNLDTAKKIAEAGFVTRVTMANDEDTWSQAVGKKTQLLGTDEVNFYSDPWSRTNNHLGWPFLCPGADCACRSEGAGVFYIDAISKDLWGTADSFTFLYERQSADAPHTWNAAISTPDSNVESWAKGCVMARADTSPGSPYFAVCRTAAEHKLRVQYRLQANGETQSKDIVVDAIDQHQDLFVQLALKRDTNGQTCAEGYGGALTAKTPRLIARQCFSGRLPLQGAGASAHDDTVDAQSAVVKFLFFNLTKTDADGASRDYGTADLQHVNIGDTAAAAAAADGYFPGEGWFSYQTDWHSRNYGVGNGGQSQFLAPVSADATADYVYNRDGTQEMRVLLSTGTSFGSDRLWGTRSYGVGYEGHSQWLADVDGGGQRSDYIYNRDDTREIRVMLSTGSGFAADRKWGERTHGVGYDGASEWMVDVNGDDRADYVYNRNDTREIWVMLSTGSGFAADRKWGQRTHGVGYDGASEWMVDLTGDGRADYVYNRDGTREIWVMVSTGSGFAADRKWGERTHGVGYAGRSEWLVDVNGDDRADYVYNRDDTREIRVMLSTGSGFAADRKWGERTRGVGYDGASEWMVDLTGDGRADYVYNQDGSRQYWALVAKDGRFATDTAWGVRAWGVGWDGRGEWFADVNGDGRADQVNNRNSTQENWVMTSQACPGASTAKNEKEKIHE
jgi:hypothetical protein